MGARQSKLGGRPARILIVDDHPAVREGLAQAIAQNPDLLVCGQTAGAAGALELLETANPDLAVVDVAQHGGGFDLVRILSVSNGGIPVLAWSAHGHPLYAETALRAGATGFVTKGHPPAAIVSAIRRVLEGKTYLSDDVMAAMRKRSAGKSTVKGLSTATRDLSARERDVLRLVGQGNNTRQIAAALGISPKTVTTYRDRLKEKLDLQNNTELVMWAVLWAAEIA